MRDLDTIDSERRLIAAVRRSIREHGGVWMRRLPEVGMLSAKLARGDVDMRLARRIAARWPSFTAGPDRVLS